MLALLSRNDELIGLLREASVLPMRGRRHHAIRCTPVYRDVARLDDATIPEADRLIENIFDRFAEIERAFDEDQAKGRRSTFTHELRRVRAAPNSGRPDPSGRIYEKLDNAYSSLATVAQHHTNRSTQISARLQEGMARVGDVYTRIIAKVQEFEQQVDQWLHDE
jgi:hypothetical protein